MKVLKKAATWEPRRVTCQDGELSCGAELEIELGDLRRIHYDADGQREPAYDKVFIICPECGRQIDIRDVPPCLTQKIPDSRGGWQR